MKHRLWPRFQNMSGNLVIITGQRFSIRTQGDTGMKCMDHGELYARVFDDTHLHRVVGILDDEEVRLMCISSERRCLNENNLLFFCL